MIRWLPFISLLQNSVGCTAKCKCQECSNSFGVKNSECSSKLLFPCLSDQKCALNSFGGPEESHFALHPCQWFCLACVFYLTYFIQNR